MSNEPLPQTPIFHDYITDSWRLFYDATSNETIQTLEPLPAGDFTILVTVVEMPALGGIGLTLRSDADPLLSFLARINPAPSTFYALTFLAPETPFQIRIEFDADTDLATLGWSPFGSASWTVVGTIEVPGATQAGMLLSWDPGSPQVGGTLNQFRIMEGLWDNQLSEFELGAPGVPPPSVPMAITIDPEPRIISLVGAQFGDLEFDVGKSVSWSSRFVDHTLITEVNLGTQRYWIVDWTKSFDNAESHIVSIDFFTRPVDFRKAQFSAAVDRLDLEDTDWILFCDAHEMISCDTRSEPDDASFLLFKSYFYRELDRAPGDRITLPFFALLRYDYIQNLVYDNGAVIPAGVPFYLPADGLTRLIRVSALRDPAFDWHSIDQPSAPDPDVKLQLISYAYAHWNLQEIEPGQTTPPRLDAENDLGWQQRNLISIARPLPGLPFGAWQDPDRDPVGVRGPWAPDLARSADFQPIAPYDPDPGAIDPAAAGVLVPMYDRVLRLNMRDGVWYDNTTGNTPLMWSDSAQDWIPAA